jgi:hypothetical protein
MGQESRAMRRQRKTRKTTKEYKKQNPDWTRKEGRNTILLNINWNMKQEPKQK